MRVLAASALSKGDPRVVAAEATLERLTAESERLSALYDSRSAVWTAASHTLSAVEAYLKNGIPSGVVLEDHESDVPKPVKGENGLLDQIVNCRRRSRELRADLSRLSSSPYPSAYCKQRMRQQIEEMAARGAVSVSRLVERRRNRGGIPVWGALSRCVSFLTSNFLKVWNTGGLQPSRE